ncbi:cell wall hydrolase [Sphingomicrobium flavum]|uniref:cell wall hydrolase n=1 Tax=Sphingomicrobium flavum TaxID=1229164 RepID=UPI0021AD9FD2|nr:cell wall hydrolase [Sphingomicrobium flavum]
MAQTFQQLPVVSSIWDRETPVEDFQAELAEAEAPKSLPELVEDYRHGEALDEQGRCLATAIYFEARGEDLEGQLAVADVVKNRAMSGKYPSDWCNVIKQRAQFSFVENRRFPAIRDNKAWEIAQAVARVAIDEAHEIVPDDVLWYHADYVAPVWGKRLNKVAKVGVHIFYS